MKVVRYIYIYIYTLIHAHIYIHTYMYTPTCIHTCIHIYIHMLEVCTTLRVDLAGLYWNQLSRAMQQAQT